MPIRVGVGSYTFPWAVGIAGFPVQSPMTPLELVKQTAQLGLTVCQICDNMPLHTFDEQDLGLLASEAQSKGILLEVGTRGIGAPWLYSYLDVCAVLKSRVLRTLVDKDEVLEDPTELAERIEPIVHELTNREVILVIENYEAYTSAWLHRLVSEIDSPYVRVCLDPVNCFGISEDPLRVVTTLGPLVGNVHIKDYKITREEHRLGYRITGTPAGAGMLPTQELLKSLDPADELSGIVELWTPFQGNVEDSVRLERAWAEQSIENIRRILPDAK